MKKILVSLMLVSFVFVFSCKKGDTGPQGPAGPTGVTGATGPTGATGSANVQYSDWFSFALTDWKDTLITNIDQSVRAFKTASALTQPILDSGVVLCYLKDPSGIIFPMPMTYNKNPARSYGYIPMVGKFLFYEYALDGSGGFKTAANKFRYIIIPGGVKATGGRTISWNRMSYTDVCAALQIAE